jgi:hypothetical protein
MRSVFRGLGILGFIIGLAYSDPTGPAYPPPGGVTFTSSGNSGSAGGEVYNFSNFNFSQFGSLWWGPTNASDLPADSSAGIQNVNAPGYMTFSGYDSTATGLNNSGGYVWNSTANWTFDSLNDGVVNVPTRFVLNFAGNANPTTKAMAAIPSGDPAEEVANITGNFQGNFVFEADFQGTWRPVLDFYNSAHCISGCGVDTSADFGFWSTPPASTVPEPRFYGFLMVGMITLIAMVRRYRLSS